MTTPGFFAPASPQAVPRRPSIGRTRHGESMERVRCACPWLVLLRCALTRSPVGGLLPRDLQSRRSSAAAPQQQAASPATTTPHAATPASGAPAHTHVVHSKKKTILKLILLGQARASARQSKRPNLTDMGPDRPHLHRWHLSRRSLTWIDG